ncbi:MAG: amylo-alpha-1,6-glucosidase, partial [Methylobacter sp.]
SGSLFMLIEAILGMSFKIDRPQLRLFHPRLPDYLGWLRIQGLRYGTASIDLIVRRHDQDIAVNIERRSGELELIVIL